MLANAEVSLSLITVLAVSPKGRIQATLDGHLSGAHESCSRVCPPPGRFSSRVGGRQAGLSCPIPASPPRVTWHVGGAVRGWR